MSIKHVTVLSNNYNANIINHIIQIITLSLLMIVQFSCANNESQQQQSTNNQNVGIWTRLSTNSPSMRASNAMAYDTLHKKIINYGGRSGFPDFDDINETWAFDYNSKTWTNLKPSNSPPWRTSHSMVYDELRHKVLIFGGGDFSKVFNDLWEYDYSKNTWTKRSTNTPPEARQMHGMVYIPDRDVILIFGGRSLNGGASFADVWEFNCKTSIWKKLNPKNTPPVSDHVNMTYDKSVRKLLLFTNSQTWAFNLDTENWTKLHATNPPDTDHSNFVYSDHHQVSILFGDSKSTHKMITWTFNYSENSWTDITSNNFPTINFYENPPVIEHDALVYINDLNVFIQYGGCCSDQTLQLSLNK